MIKLHRNAKGFTIVEVLLVLIAITLISGAAYFVEKHRSENNQVTGNVATTKAKTTNSYNPYIGWNSATLKYEKLSFQYPPNWTLKNTSYIAGSPNVSCVNPGTDNATLAISSYESMILQTGSACSATSATQVASLPITVLGNKYFISILDNDLSSTDNGLPTEACLSTSSSSLSGLPSKNIFIDPADSGSPIDFFCYLNQPVNNATPVHKATAVMESDSNFNKAKLVFESLKYQ